jgi:hypothetical protein
MGASGAGLLNSQAEFVNDLTSHVTINAAQLKAIQARIQMHINPIAK